MKISLIPSNKRDYPKIITVLIFVSIIVVVVENTILAGLTLLFPNLRLSELIIFNSVLLLILLLPILYFLFTQPVLELLRKLHQVGNDLEQNNNFLRESEKVADLGTYVYHLDKDCWDNSPILNSILGYISDSNFSFEEVLKIVHPGSLDLVKKTLLVDVLENRSDFSLEFQIIRQDNRQSRWVHGRGAWEYDDQYAPVKLIGSIQNVTDRKRSEQALRHANSLLYAMINNTDEYILISDENAFPIKFNSAYAQIMKLAFGIEMKPGIKPHKLTDNKDVIKWWDGLHERVLSGEKFQVEFSHLFDNTMHHFEIFFNPIFENNKVTGFTEFTRDITNRKKAESELKQYQDHLEELIEQRTTELKDKQAQLVHSGRLASLGEMATGVAHELNQPLSIIRAQSELLQILHDKTNNSEETEQSEAYQVIVKQVDRAAEIINQMRGFSRKSSLPPHPIQPAEHIETSLIFFREQLRVNEIKFSVDIPENLPEILFDAQKFEQVFVNFIMNARHAVDMQYEIAGPEYQKEIDLTVQTDLPKSLVSFSIKDNGIGMSSEVKERCLDPFYTTKEVGEGTGLGLSIVSGIIQEYNGKLEIESEPNCGTTVTMHLPIHQK